MNRLLPTLYIALIALPVMGAQDATLPAYCKARFEKETNHSEYKKWEDRYGPDFLHVHHLCHGISALNKAYHARTEQQKRGLLDQAMNEFGYVINHAKPTFGLLSDLYLYRSDAHLLRRNHALAMRDLLHSISINPRQTRAYLAASDLYVKLNQKDQAVSLLASGLRHLPDSQSLRKKYVGLGGDVAMLKHAGQEQDKKDSEQNASARSISDSDRSGQEASAAETAKAAAAANYALYSLSRAGHGGMQHKYNAGDYIYLEVVEDPKSNGDVVLFRLISAIPEIHSRIGSIGVDLGRNIHLFTRLEPDSFLGQYYPIRFHASPYRHPFWPGFSAHYHAEASIDPKIAKPNDPRKMSPGNTLTIKAHLSPGMRYENVIEALNRGLASEDGLRVAVIALHLAGPPLPSGTRSDDGGYFTGRLLKTKGPYFERTRQKEIPEKVPASGMTADQPARAPLIEASPPSAPSGEGVKPKNPWCRFCPAE